MIKLLFSFILGSSLACASTNSQEPLNDPPTGPLIYLNPPHKKLLSIENKINILVWNVYKFNLPNAYSDFRKLAIKKDLILLQENYLTEKTVKEHTSNKPLNKFHHIIAPFVVYKNYETGVSTATRYKYMNTYSLISPVYEPFVRTRKTTSYTYFKVKGLELPLLVINVHGINFVRLKTFKKHMEQIFAEIKKHNGPIILAGDFNTHTRGRTKYFLAEAKKYDIELLHPEIDNRFLKLDHILARGLKANFVRLRYDIISSDHLAIEAQLSFKSGL